MQLCSSALNRDTNNIINNIIKTSTDNPPPHKLDTGTITATATTEEKKKKKDSARRQVSRIMVIYVLLFEFIFGVTLIHCFASLPYSSALMNCYV